MGAALAPESAHSPARSAAAHFCAGANPLPLYPSDVTVTVACSVGAFGSTVALPEMLPSLTDVTLQLSITPDVPGQFAPAIFTTGLVPNPDPLIVNGTVRSKCPG